MLASRAARALAGGCARRLSWQIANHCKAALKRPGITRAAPQKRSFLALPQGEALPVIGGLIGANVAVYGAWQVCDPRLMTAHFTLSNDDVLSKPHTLLTSMFSHASGWHLLGNMVTLFFFGPEVVGALGAATFLGVYGQRRCGAGLTAGCAQLAANAYRNSQRPAYFRQPAPRCLGASGAVNSAVAYSVLLNPWRMIIIFAEFIPLPMPAILYGGAFLAKDLGPLLDIHIPYVSDRAHGVAHGAHVGGTMVGVGAFFLLARRGQFRRWK